MVNWNNLDTVGSFKELIDVKKVNLPEVMSGEQGADRVKKYNPFQLLVYMEPFYS